MRFLIGLDDTDSPRGSSTGELALRLGESLQSAGLGRLDSVTRHQLFTSPQVARTTRNSACCITLEGDTSKSKEMEMACRTFLLREYSSGSNAGYAFASWIQVTFELVNWARLVKSQKVTRAEAIAQARASGIAVAGLCGTGAGVIGAVAAIGLRYRGEDGRFLWLPGLDEAVGSLPYSDLMSLVPFDRIENLRGRTPRPSDKVVLGHDFQALLRDGRCVLLVDEVRTEAGYEWRTLPKEKLRELAD
jgi:hypothetical protein